MPEPTIHKLTSPRMPAILPRERLFARLDEGCQRPGVWIQGPGGVGKSTLASSYLESRGLRSHWYQVDPADADPANVFYYLGELARAAGTGASLPLFTAEYRSGIEAFTRRYFETFFQPLTRPAALVFDDYHEPGEAEGFQRIVQGAIQEAPEGVTVFVLSRTPPPPSLARLRAGRKLALLGWPDLRLDLEETRGIVRLYRDGSAGEAQVEALHERVRGWVAGLILLLERGLPDRGEAATVNLENAAELFDFFAGELFDRATAETRDFLLRTAFLPEITPEAAGRLTGVDAPGPLLEELHRRNHFTERRLTPAPTYRYHPLLREFLHHRVERALPPTERAALQRDSARVLEETGRPADAAELYASAEAWTELHRLILEQAPVLAAQGRTATLYGWLQRLPGGDRDRDPWLPFWQGVCRLPRSFAEARAAFEEALEGFLARDEAEGVYLAWASIVDTYPFELDALAPLDAWIDRFAELREHYPTYPSPAIELRVAASLFVSLVLRPTRTAEIATWADRVERLLLANEDLAVHIQTGFYRSVYAIWLGDFRKNEEVVRELCRIVETHPLPPFQVLTVRMLEAMHAWLTGEHEACMRAVAEGLELSRTTGISAWDPLLYACGAEGALIVEDFATARQMHQALEKTLLHAGSLMVNYYHNIAAWLALHEDDPATALFHLRETAGRVERLASPYHQAVWYLGRAQAFLLSGDAAAARVELAGAREYGERMGSQMIRFLVLLGEAQASFSGDEDAGLTSLRQAFAVGREEGYWFSVWFLPRIMAELCARALSAEIEVDYVRELIRTRGLAPPRGVEVEEHWPWPFRIHTLGRFGLERDGIPLNLPGKAPKKPLELLRVLVAHGGRAVAERELFDDLWSGADPVTAGNALKTTVHRLRRLLGNPDAVQVNESRVSLSRELVWVDAWAVEHLFSRARQAWLEGRAEEARQFAERALRDYRGPFLPGDADRDWSHSRREKLQERFRATVHRLGQDLLEEGRLEAALESYRRGLEVDDRSEALYRDLLAAYRRAGREAEAAALAQRCWQVLAAAGRRPSPQTQALLREIGEGDRWLPGEDA